MILQQIPQPSFTLSTFDPYTATGWLVHWPLMGGLLHLVQKRRA